MQIMGEEMNRKLAHPSCMKFVQKFRSEKLKGRDRSNDVGVVWVTVLQMVLRQS